MNWIKSSRVILIVSFLLVVISFLVANLGRALEPEDALGRYHAVRSFIPWLMQWGAIVLVLKYLSLQSSQQRGWLTPLIVLPYLTVGTVWWIAMLSAVWNVPILEFVTDRVISYASEYFGGPMSLEDWLLYLGWLVNLHSESPFSLLGWGGVTAFVHSVSVTLVFCGLSYANQLLHER